MAWQFTPKTVMRAGYGIFYGGQENGPYSNPSPGFNPPFFVNESFVAPCSASAANPGQQDCRVTQIPALAGGFPANSLVDPNTPIFFSVDKNLRTPYMQQWHFQIERELPGNSVFSLTYAGSKGTRLYTFFNGNQAAPDANPNDATAPRRPVSASLLGAGPCTLATPENCAPVFDTLIDWFRSTGMSSYNSLQAHYEKRFSHGLELQGSYTWAHSIDIASNANLGPTQNNSDFRDFRHPEAERGNSDFDVRHRLVVSSIWELPVGRGKHFLGNASGFAEQVGGRWRTSLALPLETGTRFSMGTETLPMRMEVRAECPSGQTRWGIPTRQDPWRRIQILLVRRPFRREGLLRTGSARRRHGSIPARLRIQRQDRSAMWGGIRLRRLGT
jgi:hypothetical protein